MQYIVLEIQASSDNVATLVTKHNTEPEAQAKYHDVLAHAALSAVPVHSALLMTDDGGVMRSETYRHESE